MKHSIEKIKFIASLTEEDFIVIVVNNGHTYSTHERMRDTWKLDKYFMNHIPDNGAIAKVIRKGEINRGANGYAIETENQQYIIGETGVRRISLIEAILTLIK